jgi:hypothetical protein
MFAASRSWSRRVADPFVDLRIHLQAAVNDAIAGLDYSHSQLLGQRISALSHDAPDAFLPALLCALTAEALGAPNEISLMAATSLAIVEAAAYVVDDLVIAGSGSDIEPRGLIRAWGVPRTLNAADGFFALAHDSISKLHGLGISAQATLEVADELNEACRAWAEESDARFAADVRLTQHPSDALLAAGVRLGARVGAFTDSDALVDAVLDGDAARIQALNLQPSAAARLADAASYLAGVPRT